MGPLVGTVIYVILHFQLARYAGYSLLIQGIILVIIMLVAPQGILGLIRDVRNGGGLRTRLKLLLSKPASETAEGVIDQ